LGEVRIGTDAVADESVLVGYPSPRCRPTLLAIGPDARLRSGTVVYAGSTLGRRLETGHNVIIREETRVGNDVSIWSNSVIDYGCVIGDRVKIHANCYVSQYTELEDDVFLAPPCRTYSSKNLSILLNASTQLRFFVKKWSSPG